MRFTAVLCAVALLAIVLSSGVAADTGETVVVDRIEGEQAVLLVETDGVTTDQRVVDVDDLPVDGRQEGAVLQPVDGGYAYDEAETERRRSDAESRFDQLTDGGSDDSSRFGTCRFGPLGHLWWC